MAVPSSGPLRLRNDINLEVNDNVTDTNVALHQLSIDAGFSTPDSMGDFYGYTSVYAPSVTTNAATSVTDTAMTLNGNVTDDGKENVSRGFYHGTNGTTSTSNTKYTLGGTQSTGTFACTRTGLSYGTAYYFWAFACNSAGETIASRVQSNTAYPPYTPTNMTGGWVCTYGSVGGTCNICESSRCIRHTLQGGWMNPYNAGKNYVINFSCGIYNCAGNPMTQGWFCCCANTYSGNTKNFSDSRVFQDQTCACGQCACFFVEMYTCLGSANCSTSYGGRQYTYCNDYFDCRAGDYDPLSTFTRTTNECTFGYSEDTSVYYTQYCQFCGPTYPYCNHETACQCTCKQIQFCLN